MVVNGIQVSSPYTRELINGINALAGRGKKTFTPDELLKSLGRKNTVSFRRRMKELVHDGVIEKFQYLTERGGYAVAYQLCPKWEQMSLPEFPF